MYDNERVTCSHCGITLTNEHSGPCPSCEKEGRNIRITPAPGVLIISSSAVTLIHEYYKKNKPIWFLSILVAVLSPFVGYFIAGPIGIVIALILGGISYLITPHAIIKIREIRSG